MIDRAEICTIRVIIVDDHAIVRKGIRALLATETDIDVIGEARDGREAIARVKELDPDVVLMDLVMPGMDGLEAIDQIHAQHPEARVLVLTSFASMDKILPAIKAGAMGYMLKDSGPAELVRAIHQVYSGDSSLHPAIARKLLREIAHPPEQDPAIAALTEREVQVLQLVARGQSDRSIADQFQISEATVRTHMSHILSKLKLSSRTQAALYALRKGLASLDDVDTC